MLLKSIVKSLSLLRWDLESVSDLEKVSDESLREGFSKAIESNFRTSEKVFQVPRKGELHLYMGFSPDAFLEPRAWEFVLTLPNNPGKC